MITVCPSEEELLAVASGEPASNELESHLRDCARCLRKISGLKQEVHGLRLAFGSGAPSPFVPGLEQQPASGPGLNSTPTADFDDANHSAEAPQPLESAAPSKIGKYLIVSVLGSGGQGSVYRAVHPTLNEQVVLKLSSRTVDDSDGSLNDRLISEGRVLCQLKHPNIGRIHDLDFFQRRPFLVMDYVKGRSLDQYLRDHITLTAGWIAAMIAKVARALDAAHRLGIVHQDVKPQNIIIDEHDEPKLIDFGMARLNGAWEAGRRQPLGGTLQYMAPEQAHSDPSQITSRSDVFALGAVLYFLICRKPPFMGATRQEVLSQVSECRFDREALLSSGVLPRLGQITLKALSAEPQERFASAQEMAEALESLNRAATRRRLLVRVVPMILIVCAAGMTTYLWPKPAPIPPAGQLLITPDGHRSLDGSLPLTTGEKLKFEANVPRDTQSVLFWIGAGGKIFKMPSAQTQGDNGFDRLISPGQTTTTTLAGPPGTEFLLLISAPKHASAEQIDALQQQLQTFFTIHPLGSLPSTGAVIIDPSGVQTRFLNAGERSRDPGGESPESCAGVSQPLNDLSRQLKSEGYFFTGIAVPHEDDQQQ